MRLLISTGNGVRFNLERVEWFRMAPDRYREGFYGIDFTFIDRLEEEPLQLVDAMIEPEAHRLMEMLDHEFTWGKGEISLPRLLDASRHWAEERRNRREAKDMGPLPDPFSDEEVTP